MTSVGSITLWVEASSTGDPKHLSVEDLVVHDTEKGQDDDNLTESQGKSKIK